MTDLELHAAELVEDVTHVVADDRPCDAVVALRCRLNNVARHVVERDHVLQHPDRLVERTEPETEQHVVTTDLSVQGCQVT